MSNKIILEDFSEGDGYYKVDLAYLTKTQVEEIEALVSKWKPTDEDIKACIGMCLTDVNEQRFKDYGTNLRDCLAWIEKQSDKDKLIKELGKYKVKYTQEVLSQQLEKQGEQNTTNKVEPKFKVGDWITDGDCKCQITFIDSSYWYSETCVLGEVESIDKKYHLWTIQDAKDGDILASKSERPFIFKGLLDKLHPESPVAYCGIDCDYNFFLGICSMWRIDEEVYPATKELREFLFQKMKEAGYEWNAEKKELRKIEMNSNDRLDPLIDEEIDLWIKENSNIHHDNNNIVELMRDMAYYVATLTRNLYKQKSKWTEEDEKTMKTAISFLIEFKNKGYENAVACIDWLNSIKQRMEEQQ